MVGVATLATYRSGFEITINSRGPGFEKAQLADDLLSRVDVDL